MWHDEPRRIRTYLGIDKIGSARGFYDWREPRIWPGTGEAVQRERRNIRSGVCNAKATREYAVRPTVALKGRR